MGTTLLATLLCAIFPVMTMSLGRRTTVYVGGRRRIKRLPLSNFLEYRPASPVDRIRATQDYTDSAMFVAVETRYPHQPEAVVGSAEFGVVKTPKHGDWVYITNIFAHEGYRGEGVEAEIRVLGVWIDHRLSFQHHIKVRCAEAKAKLGRLRHLGWARAGITGKKVIKTYKVAIVPALSHAVSAWKEGLESATAKSALLQVSAMVARIALQAPRSSSNAALCVAAGIMPADLELGTIAATRLAALGCAKALDQSLSVKGLTLFEGRDGGDMVQRWRGLPTQPWHPWVTTTISEREEAKNYALEALQTKNAIFTDGSVVKDVKTGAALVVYREGVEVYSNFWKLSPYATITDCELLGVLEAVRWIVSTAGDEAWEIFTDSQAVLKILSSRSSTARWDKARQIYLSLSENPCANERADELAAKGASMREVSAETEISVRTLRRYQGEAGRLSLRKAPTPAHLYRCGVVNSPECDCEAPARNRVKGGVPYHLYKLIVDLKRRKSFNQLCSALMQYLDARRGL
ncbi:hypothetical protein FOZ60_010189, partial [Perkinsus olseni]